MTRLSHRPVKDSEEEIEKRRKGEYKDLTEIEDFDAYVSCKSLIVEVPRPK